MVASFSELPEILYYKYFSARLNDVASAPENP
jgi:hypothetical protein